MTLGNGNPTPDVSRDLTPVIADAILGSLQPTGSRAAAAAQPSWLSFAAALDKLIATNPALERKVEETLARTARAALVARDVAVPSMEDFLRGMRSPEVGTRGGTVVRAFWWGWHVQISHQDLNTFLGAAVPINTIIGTIGGGVPSPAAPFIAIAAAFIAGALELLRGLDKGSGVYVSMSWFAPGIFIPTTV